MHLCVPVPELGVWAVAGAGGMPLLALRAQGSRENSSLRIPYNEEAAATVDRRAPWHIHSWLVFSSKVEQEYVPPPNSYTPPK